VIGEAVQDIEGDFTDDAGRVELRDAVDQLLAFMPVSDALSVEYQIGEETRQDTVQLRKRLWKQDGIYYLLVGARVDRLNGMHTGAITFDPTFTTQPGSEGKDTYLYVNNGNKHYGGDTGLIDDGTNYVMLIEFDCSSVPAGASCSAATLYLYAKVDKGAQTVTFHELTVANEDWLESNTQPDPGYGLTVWDHKIEESGPAAGDEENWAGAAGASTSGTDYLAGSIGAVSYAAGAAGTEGSGALTTGDVEDWFGASNQNYGLRGKRTVGGQQAIVCSSDHATAGWRPKLVIEYTSRIPRHPAVVYQCPAIY